MTEKINLFAFIIRSRLKVPNHDQRGGVLPGMAHRDVCVDCPLVEAPAPPRLDESFLQSGSAAFLSALLQSADRPRPLDKLVSFNIC